jgi:hypothetical protein
MVASDPTLALEHDYADAVPIGVRLLLEVLDGRSHVW